MIKIDNGSAKLHFEERPKLDPDQSSWKRELYLGPGSHSKQRTVSFHIMETSLALIL